MKKFISGILVGTAVTATALADVATAVKKTVIDPIKEKEDVTKENRKKTIRKHIAR